MHATNAAQDLRAKAARLNEQARRREQKRKTMAAALAPAPVAVDVQRIDLGNVQGFESLGTPALAPPSIEATVDLIAQLLAGAPRVDVTQASRIASCPLRGSADWGPDSTPDREEWAVDEMDTALAGLRGHLAQDAAYGPRVSRLVVVAYGGGGRRTIVAHGRLSAFHRAFPDSVTRQAWAVADVYPGKTAERAAAVEVFPLWLDLRIDA